MIEFWTVLAKVMIAVGMTLWIVLLFVLSGWDWVKSKMNRNNGH